MLTFNQLQEKKTKIKINPKVQDQYEHHKKDADGNTIPHEELEEERAARKMNVRTKSTIKKQIAKDAAAEAKRREKKTGEYAEKPKRKPKLKKPSQLTTVKAEPKKEAPKPKAKPAAKKAAPKPKAKPVAAAKKVTPKAAPKKSAPKAKAKPAPKPAPKKAAPKPAAKKEAPKKEAPKKSGVSDRVRDAIKKGVKRHRKATQGARVFGKGFARGVKDTVKFAGKVKKAVVGEEKLTFKQFVNVQEADIADILARLEKKRISKGGNPDDSPLPAMKKYHADKKKKVKKEEVEFDEGSAYGLWKGDGKRKLPGDKKKNKDVKEEVFDEATRLKKEKGYDKGGTKKPSGKPTAMSVVLDKIRKEYGHGAVVGQGGSRQQKKVKGAKSTAGTGKYKKAADNKKQTASDAKKRGFSNVQNYVDTMARYGGKSNYDKGRGLGT